MDERYAPQPIARWYLFAAAISLLVMVLLLIGAWVQLTTDSATLPLDERAQFEAEPIWMAAVFGLTGLAGTIGGILLLLRLKSAEWLMMISLGAVALWFAGLFATPRLRELLTTGQIAAALALVAVVWTVFWFARHSRQRGWLR